ncbi:MAG: hypothetical protein ACUVQQ_13210 [Thermogutta sp.]
MSLRLCRALLPIRSDYGILPAVLLSVGVVFHVIVEDQWITAEQVSLAKPTLAATLGSESTMTAIGQPRLFRRARPPRSGQAQAGPAETVAPSTSTSSKGDTKTPDGSKPAFIRLLEKNGEPIALQTAIASYRPQPEADKVPADVRVDLVGVIHLGEKAYYEKLNDLLAKYDVVLYELVAPEGTRVPQGGGQSSHPISFLQRGMSAVLGLTYQLSVIDYHRDNFVHADLSPEEFAKSMEERGESLWAMVLRSMGYQMAKNASGNAKVSDADLLAAFFSKNRNLELKRAFARQLAEDPEGQIQALEGPQGSTLIAGRNERVLQVLQREIAKGHRKIAIFYGAGHMPHFHDRLTEIGLQVAKTRWLNAWDLRDPAETTR